jgi:hypothetical protein
MALSGIASSTLSGSSITRQSLALRQTAAPPAAAEREDDGNGSFDAKGLDALRQEIRAVLKQNSRVSVTQTAFVPPTPSSVASGVLAAAAELAAADPLAARDALARLRQDIVGAADDVRAIVSDDALDDVEDAIGRIETGLARAEADAGRNVVSSASVLEASSVVRQRSTIRIRTQEGDVVTLNLRSRESLRLSDSSLSDATGSASSTELSVSSRSKLSLRIEGDINADEMQALRRVFEQADAIADEFFNGDVGEAFRSAADFSFDNEQLAAVSLNFRERETTRVDVRRVERTAPAVAPAPSQEPARKNTPVDPETVAPAPVDVDAKPPSVPPPEAIVAPETKAAAAATEAAQVVETAPGAGRVAAPEAVELFDVRSLIGKFLAKTREGFEAGVNRAFFSESFRLELLRSTLEVRGIEVADGDPRAASEERDDD